MQRGPQLSPGHAVAELAVIDAHVHFWDPERLEYSWLSQFPPLARAWLPLDYAAANHGTGVAGVVFVEANCRPDQNLLEARFVERVIAREAPVRAIVAFVDLTSLPTLHPALDRLSEIALVRGVRHNIQGTPPGFCLQPSFVQGVLEVGRRGLAFDLCATHDQLHEVLQLVNRAPDTRFVLDHCGKPPIRERRLEPWRTHIARLAGCDNVWCKLSGLLTEADPEGWADSDLVPHAAHVVEQFGTDRVMYGSDWPVLTLALRHEDWYGFTRRFTDDWSPHERQAFYHDNALRFYDI